MIWLIILLVFLGFIAWLLISPLLFEVDTRIPYAGIKWRSVGGAFIWYEKEWWLTIWILFYRKTIRFSEIKRRPGNNKDTLRKKEKKRMKIRHMLKNLLKLMMSFRVTEWDLAIDTGDNVRNAQLYPLNFLPYTFRHLEINFRNENYFVLKIRNRPWKILIALIRQYFFNQ